MAIAAVMDSVFLWNYVPLLRDDRIGAIVLGVLFVPAIIAFTILIGVGFRRWRKPPKVLEVTAEGVRMLVAGGRGVWRIVRWTDMKAVVQRQGTLWIELRDSTAIGRSRTERWAFMGQRLFGRSFDGIVIPAGGPGLAPKALQDLLDARIEREMLGGDIDPGSLPSW